MLQFLTLLSITMAGIFPNLPEIWPQPIDGGGGMCPDG
jgi:hypothetical protein